jgi:leader peptidase (prepilin peptidase)/N-methyltransferase
MVESLTALFAVALVARFGLGWGFLIAFVFVAALIVITFIDLEVRIVPDRISIPGAALGFLVAVVHNQWPIDRAAVFPGPWSSLIGLVIGGGSLLLVAWVYYLLTGTEGMGGGDVKLLAMIGAFLGWPAVPLTLFIASLSGSIIGIALMLKSGIGGKYALPFAPFLCLGAIVYLFFGSQILALYVSFAPAT